MHGLSQIFGMNGNKPKIGDRVSYNNLQSSYNGTIIKVDEPVKDDNGKLGALVEWDDKNLIPPTMAVPYNTLTLLPKGTNNLGHQPAHPSCLPSGNQLFDIGQDPWCQALDQINNPDTNCPVCHTEWTKTPNLGGYWHDCKKCNKTKENILKETR